MSIKTMAYTFQELRVKTVAQLRDIAAGLGDEAVKGYSQLNKDHLLAAICKALNIDMHVHHQAEGAIRRN
jgi:Rho termination factor-like protein